VKLLEFKSNHNHIICHPDQIDYIVRGNEVTSGVVINTNFCKVSSMEELERIIEEYDEYMNGVVEAK
jgi:hypothetical protein